MHIVILIFNCVLYRRLGAYTNTDCSLHGTAVWNIHNISSCMEKAIRGMYCMYGQICIHVMRYINHTVYVSRTL